MSKGIMSPFASQYFTDAQAQDNRITELKLLSEGIEVGIQQLIDTCHYIAAASGWWHESANSQIAHAYVLKERNFGEMMALIHSELSEGLEGYRKNQQSDHMPAFSMLEEELADAIIRIADMAGAMQLELGKAIVAKLLYNCKRPDHKLENRAAKGGKKF